MLAGSAGLVAGRFAIELVNSLLPADLQGVQGGDKITLSPFLSFDADGVAGSLRAQQSDVAFGPTTASIVREAEARGIS
ncbi:hypothetical protein REMIM1_PF00972 (plasmid) [Rhizobium etli bv. mimosae str. Mim1]|nr:hypothetical protein REMIM1_PF00972 [Rhizobium etli bv. mimosae str. Mim1]